jgi:hypothetical protein
MIKNQNGANLVGILDLFRGSKDEQIAKRFISVMRALGESRRLEFDSKEFLIRKFDADGSAAGNASLHNLRYELKKASVGEQDAIYLKYARSSVEERDESATYENTKPRLGVLLKDAGYPEYISLLNRVELSGEEGRPMLWRPVTSDVIACCIEETEVSLRFLTEADIEKWRVPVDQVFADALANVRAKPCEWRAYGAAHGVAAPDSYIAARLLCDESILALAVRGRPVAVVPDRDTLFVTGSEDEEGLAGLAILVEQQLKEANRRISARPMELTKGGWQPFEPPASVRNSFARSARMLDAEYWEGFQAALEKDLSARDQDIFVARLSVYTENDTGVAHSMVVWSKDVDSIFPVADRVHFYEGKDKPTRVALWADVMRVMGPFMKNLEGLPVRYRVNAFPNAEQMAAMGAQMG